MSNLFTVLLDDSDSEENQILNKQENNVSNDEQDQDNQQDEFQNETQKGILLESDYLTLNPININQYNTTIEKKKGSEKQLKKKEKSVTFSTFIDESSQSVNETSSGDGGKKSFDPTTRKNRFNKVDTGRFGIGKSERKCNSTSHLLPSSSDYQSSNNYHVESDSSTFVYQVESSNSYDVHVTKHQQPQPPQPSTKEQQQIQYTYQVECSNTIDDLVTKTNESLNIRTTSFKSKSTIGLKEYYESINRERVASIPVDERKVTTTHRVFEDTYGESKDDENLTPAETDSFIELKPKDRAKIVSKSKAKQKSEIKSKNLLSSSTKNVIVLPPEFTHIGKQKSEKKDFSKNYNTKKYTNVSNNRNHDNQYQPSHNKYQHHCQEQSHPLKPQQNIYYQYQSHQEPEDCFEDVSDLLPIL